MALLQILRPTLPILIGASIMLTISMGLRQSLGLFMQPLTQDIRISVSDFTLDDEAMATLDALDRTGGTTEAREDKWW